MRGSWEDVSRWPGAQAHTHEAAQILYGRRGVRRAFTSMQLVRAVGQLEIAHVYQSRILALPYWGRHVIQK